MPLPRSEPNAPWPPKPWAPIQRDLDEAAAWYSGDEDGLARFYGGGQKPGRPSDRNQGVVAGLRRFWARRSNDRATDRQRIHVPAAADVAATSADLLFGEEPTLTIPEAHEERPDKEAKATEDRLAELVEVDGIASALLEAAEVCSGVGGVYLRPVWDPEVADRPLLTVVHADHAIPEFRWGRLWAVTFWRTVLTDGSGNIWRHLERHERGSIEHGLYLGNREHLGVRRPIADLSDTRNLDVDEDGLVAIPESLRDELLVRYVPNVLPNRKHRGEPIGRADTAGSESLMDALDETFTAWMREVRLVKPRILAPQQFLERAGRGMGANFDVDAEVFVPLDIDPASREKAEIKVAEFQLHTEEYLATCMALVERIVVTAGYSPQTFGLKAERTEITATEVRARESRSLRTTQRKQRYWQRAVEDVAEIMLVIDREIFGSEIAPMRPRLDFSDGLPDDPRQTAETIALLRQAQAISTETAVKMAQPDLEGEELAAEVQRVLEEQGLAVGDPTGGLPGVGENEGEGEAA